MKLIRLAVCLLLLAIVPAVFAQAPASTPPPPKAAAAPASGYRAEFLAQLADVEKKITSLAEAVPAEKYGWRPAAGVRSVGEVYTHIAGGNYFLGGFLGVQAPASAKDVDKLTDKAQIIAALKASFDHIRNAAISASDASLETSVTMFGMTTTHRGVFMIISNHMHEHLGQSIAYARSNGVVPPWSQK